MSKQANLYKFLIEMGRITLEKIPSPYKEEIEESYRDLITPKDSIQEEI